MGLTKCKFSVSFIYIAEIRNFFEHLLLILESVNRQNFQTQRIEMANAHVPFGAWVVVVCLRVMVLPNLRLQASGN